MTITTYSAIFGPMHPARLAFLATALDLVVAARGPAPPVADFPAR